MKSHKFRVKQQRNWTKVNMAIQSKNAVSSILSYQSLVHAIAGAAVSTKT